jgi:hypothetical protein
MAREPAARFTTSIRGTGRGGRAGRGRPRPVGSSPPAWTGDPWRCCSTAGHDLMHGPGGAGARAAVRRGIRRGARRLPTTTLRSPLTQRRARALSASPEDPKSGRETSSSLVERAWRYPEPFAGQFDGVAIVVTTIPHPARRRGVISVRALGRPGEPPGARASLIRRRSDLPPPARADVPDPTTVPKRRGDSASRGRPPWHRRSSHRKIEAGRRTA